MQNSVRKPLRLWPGVVIVTLQLLLRFAVPVVFPGALFIGVMAGPAGAVAVVLWWLFFSRAAWVERLGAIGVMIAGLFVTKRLVDVSIGTGAMGLLFFFLAIPGLSIALVAWAVATQRLPDGIRRVSMAATLLFACGVWTLVRTGGFTASDFRNDLHWRWTMTPEDPGQALAERCWPRRHHELVQGVIWWNDLPAKSTGPGGTVPYRGRWGWCRPVPSSGSSS